MNKLRMAVIGAGRLGGFHAQKLADRDDVELVAVVDPLPANRERVAAAMPYRRPVADYAGLFGSTRRRGDRLAHGLASPASPGSFSKRAFTLLVEKPLCATPAEADELVATARRRNVVLQVGHVERFNPAFHAAAAQLRDPKYIEAVRTSGFTFRSTDVGVVLDLMIHDIDLVLSMVGSPLRKVDALGFSVLGGHEDVANARLEFECGCVATLSASRVSYEAMRRMQVWSAEGFAAVDFAARTATLVRPSETLRRRQFHVDGLTPEGVEHYRQHFAEEHLPQERLTFDAVDALALELDDFIDSIRTRASRGSTARRAATPWRWPNRSSIASTPIVGTLRWTAGLARWRIPRRHVIFPRHFSPAAVSAPAPPRQSRLRSSPCDQEERHSCPSPAVGQECPPPP